jgi:hypothetical protein
LLHILHATGFFGNNSWTFKSLRNKNNLHRLFKFWRIERDILEHPILNSGYLIPVVDYGEVRLETFMPIPPNIFLISRSMIGGSSGAVPRAKHVTR